MLGTYHNAIPSSCQELSDVLASQQNQAVPQEPLNIVTDSMINKTSAMRFDDDAVLRIADTFHSLGRSSFLPELSDSVRPPPVPPSADIQRILETKAASLNRKRELVPWFAPIVCPNRDEFYNVLLAAFDSGVEVSADTLPLNAWYITNVSQNPQGISLLHVVRSTTCPDLDSVDLADAAPVFGSQTYVHDFHYRSANEVPDLMSEDAQLVVIRVLWSNGVLVAPFGFEEFHVYVRRMMHTVVARRQPRERDIGAVRATADDTVLLALADEFPWMTKDELRDILRGKVEKIGPWGVKRSLPTVPKSDKGGLRLSYLEPTDSPPMKFSKVASASASSSAGVVKPVVSGAAVGDESKDEPDAAADVVPYPDDAVARAAVEVMDELREIRDKYETAKDKDLYFYLKTLGGGWTKVHKGVSTDAAACLNRAVAAK